MLLTGFDRTDTEALVAALAHGALVAGVITGIHRHTQGNPFFVRETVQRLIDEDRLTDAESALPELTLPDGIRHVIQRRLARLSGEVNRLLTVASACDGPFRYDVVAAVAALGSDPALEVIDDALRARLIEPTAHPDTYDFSHALIRHTLYTALSPSRRARLHRQLAETMEQRYANCLAEHAAEIVHQYNRSKDLPAPNAVRRWRSKPLIEQKVPPRTMRQRISYAWRSRCGRWAMKSEPQPAVIQPETRDQEPETCLFCCEGDVWAIAFAGETHRLKDTRGMHYLAQLFAHPGREFHVNEIVTLGVVSTRATHLERGQQTAQDLGSAGEILDGEATRQYRQRLGEVRDELSEAEATNDVGRSARLREELEFLIAELASAGRGKRAASHVERARSAVGKRIRDALRQIAAVNPALGRYLRATVRTGTFCSYTPDPRLHVTCE